MKMCIVRDAYTRCCCGPRQLLRPAHARSSLVAACQRCRQIPKASRTKWLDSLTQSVPTSHNCLVCVTLPVCCSPACTTWPAHGYAYCTCAALPCSQYPASRTCTSSNTQLAPSSHSGHTEAACVLRTGAGDWTTSWLTLLQHQALCTRLLDPACLALTTSHLAPC